MIAVSGIEQLNKKYNFWFSCRKPLYKKMEKDSIPAEFLDTIELKGMPDMFRIYMVA